jgi:hypothetical protein
MRKIVTMLVLILTVLLGITAQASARGCRGGGLRGRLQSREHHHRLLGHRRHQEQGCSTCVSFGSIISEPPVPAPGKAKPPKKKKRAAILDDADERFEQPAQAELIGVPAISRPITPSNPASKPSPGVTYSVPRED